MPINHFVIDVAAAEEVVNKLNRAIQEVKNNPIDVGVDSVSIELTDR